MSRRRIKAAGGLANMTAVDHTWIRRQWQGWQDVSGVKPIPKNIFENSLTIAVIQIYTISNKLRHQVVQFLSQRFIFLVIFLTGIFRRIQNTPPRCSQFLIISSPPPITVLVELLTTKLRSFMYLADLVLYSKFVLLTEVTQANFRGDRSYTWATRAQVSCGKACFFWFPDFGPIRRYFPGRDLCYDFSPQQFIQACPRASSASDSAPLLRHQSLSRSNAMMLSCWENKAERIRWCVFSGGAKKITILYIFSQFVLSNGLIFECEL